MKQEQYILRKRNTAEHRWEWCPFCVLCLSVRSSFRIAAVRAGAAGAAAPGLGGAAAAEAGRASRGSRAGFLCGEEGSDVVTCEELNYRRFATSLSCSVASFTTLFCLGRLFTCSLCLLQQGPPHQWISRFLMLQVTMKVWDGHRRAEQLHPQSCVLQCNLPAQENPTWLVQSLKQLGLHWNNLLYHFSHYCTTWGLGLF